MTIRRIAEDTGLALYSSALTAEHNSICIPESHVKAARSCVRGLVVEEFQKTKHVLVAECPARAWQLCRFTFGADGDNQTFVYHPGLPHDAILQIVSDVPGLPPDLQPARSSSPNSWRMASASAPNKKHSKPDGRRPFIDRSQWPTAPLDAPAARMLDWASGTYLPQHMHTDILRTDAVIPLVRSFNDSPGVGPVRRVGGDITSCFTNIKHELVLEAWRYYRGRFDSSSATLPWFRCSLLDDPGLAQQHGLLYARTLGGNDLASPCHWLVPVWQRACPPG